MKRRWSKERESDWGKFCRALSRMGRALQGRKRAIGGYAPKRAPRHPLLEIVLADASIRAAIGEVTPATEEKKGLLSWASVGSAAGGAITVRLNHKGTKESCAAALSAMVAAIRKAGHRIVFHDLLRHENQNGYSMVARVRDAVTLNPGLGFAR